METQAQQMLERHCSPQLDAASSASHHQLLQPQSKVTSYASGTDTTAPAGALVMSHSSTGDRSRGSHLKLRRHIKGTSYRKQSTYRSVYDMGCQNTFPTNCINAAVLVLFLNLYAIFAYRLLIFANSRLDCSATLSKK